MGRGRFHPFSAPGGGVVPSLYGANTLDGALSETIFHNVPVRGPVCRVGLSSLRPMVVSTLAAARDLVLAQLHGHGLSRLGVSRGELIDGDADSYDRTVLWAQALHGCGARVDGLVWVSRLHDTSLSLILFGDRVFRRDLTVIEPPIPLAAGPGLERVQTAAEQKGITLVE